VLALAGGQSGVALGERGLRALELPAGPIELHRITVSILRTRAAERFRALAIER
jgi:hypothetical protein